MLAIGLPFTLMLGFSAFIVGTAVGLVAGALCRLSTRTSGRTMSWSLVSMVGLVIPNFLMASLLQLVFGVYLDWFPAGGYNGQAHPAGAADHRAGAAACRAHGAADARLDDRGAGHQLRAHGAIQGSRHAADPGAACAEAGAAFRSSPISGRDFRYLLTGSLVVEQVFALPGIGKYFISAALNRDYGLVLGTTILYMFIILALNLVVDVLYAWLDPKVRYR